MKNPHFQPPRVGAAELVGYAKPSWCGLKTVRFKTAPFYLDSMMADYLTAGLVKSLYAAGTLSFGCTQSNKT